MLYGRCGRGEACQTAAGHKGVHKYGKNGGSASLEKPCIFAIGNAPTALLRVVELAEEGRIRPWFVIGAPVGFVNVTEAKERLIASGIPCIVPRGRKGGSNVAAAIMNALLYEKAGR